MASLMPRKDGIDPTVAGPLKGYRRKNFATASVRVRTCSFS